MIERLTAYFGPEVHLAWSPLIYSDDDLLPEERALSARAVEKRKREVAAGRVLARRVLGELGFVPGPILRNPDRSPVWPAGAIGSITHSNHACIVGAARSENIELLGIDLEEETPLDSNLYPIVLVASEARWLALQPASQRGLLAKLIFSAKECAYKAQYRRTEKMLEFHEVELSIDLDTQSFEASILPGTRGVYAFEDDHIVTGIKV